jgi:Sec-independent protein translocase protein TatA
MMTLEWLIVMVLAFIVLGPKDFPRLMFICGDLIRRLKFFGGTLYENMETLSEEASLSSPEGPKVPELTSPRRQASDPKTPAKSRPISRKKPSPHKQFVQK